MTVTNTNSSFQHTRRSLRYLKPHARAIGFVLALTLSGGALLAVEPLLHKTIFDAIQPAMGDRALVVPWGVLALLAGMVVFRQTSEAIATMVTWRVRLRVNRTILSEATERLHSLPIAYHQGRGVGETMTRLDRGITAFVEALSSLAFEMIPAMVYLAMSVAIMFRLNAWLALVALAFVVPPIVLGGKTGSRLAERERVVLDRWCAIYNRFQQVLSGIKTVKAFAREKDEHEEFIRSVAGAQAASYETIRVQTRLATARGLCVNLGRVAVIVAGVVLATRGEIGAGTLVAFLGYVGGLYAPAQKLLGLYESVRKAELGLESLFAVLDAKDEVPDPAQPVTPPRIRGAVRFDNVTFQHEGAYRKALEGVSFDVQPGELIAVVGASGAGKSTLADLLLRLHDPSSGSVSVDGLDLRDLSQRGLRRQLGIVPQEAFLFDDTVRANISYAMPGASRDAIEAAARAAQAHDFISRMPDGYDTRIGRGGVSLSGGERQRVAIARTLLKDPAVVILDEPTSALDVKSEQLVQQAIEELSKGRTTFLIAHRLNTTLRASRVLVMEAGRLVEDGSPAELLAREGGVYRRMMDLWTSRDELAPTNTEHPEDLALAS